MEIPNLLTTYCWVALCLTQATYYLLATDGWVALCLTQTTYYLLIWKQAQIGE